MLATIPVKVLSLLLVPLAPLPYWSLGLPWCLGFDRRRIPLAPLIGCALAGWYAELAMILGLSPRGTVAVLTVASAAFAVVRVGDGKTEVRAALRMWLPLYLLSVLVASVAPFPALGNWSGDWYLLYRMGEHLLQGSLSGDMLARPPLFGAAAAPLWIVGPGLVPYQMMSVVASASTVTALLFFVDFFWPRSPRWLLLPLLLSPFFLHHTAAVWGKFLAAGLILAAIIEARRAHLWFSGALFALSVAVHEASIIWAPCLLVAHACGKRGWRGALRALLAMALAGLAIVGPMLVWVFARYGLHAKITNNPTLSARSHDAFPINTALVVVTTFVGWEPAVNLTRWLTNPRRLSGAVVAKESFWLVSSWFTTMAGTLIGLLFPFAFFWSRLKGDALLRGLLRPSILAAASFAVIANATLCGYYSTEGSLQTGTVALGLGLYGLLAGQLASAAPSN